jgi:hypothetical protein
MTLHQDLWSAKLPNGEVRAGTLEQLGEAFRAGLVGEATLVCAAGSDQWARLADILAVAAAPAAAPSPVFAAPGSVPPRASSAPHPSVAPRPSAAPAPVVTHNGELWQVRLANGEVRTGTRQQLEEAYLAGHLTADLLALSSGATVWRALATVLAGSVAPPAPAPVSVAPSPVAVPAPRSVAPVAPPSPRSVAPAAPAAVSDAAWQVRLPDGQVRAGTRAQLEEAVQGGHLDGNTLVLAAGASEWAPLHVALAPPATAPVFMPPAAVVPSAEVTQPAEATSSAEATAPTAVAPSAEATAPAEAAPPAETETPLAPDTLNSLPGGSPGEDTPVNKAAAIAEPLWQVQLAERQLEAAFAAGVIDDEALVMAADTDAGPGAAPGQWVRFGDVRRSRAG